MDNPKIKVVVAGDSPLMRLGIMKALCENATFEVCAETEAGPRVLSLCEQHGADCVVLDMESAYHGDTEQFLRDLRRVRPGVRVVALSEREDVEALQRAFRAGALAYLSKRDEVSMVPRALDWLCQTTERFLGDRVKERVLGDITGARVQLQDTGLDALSERERDIFRLLGAKNGPTAIARHLHISVKTVESHQESMKVKLGLPSAKELKRRAVGWLVGHIRRTERQGPASVVLAGWATIGGPLLEDLGGVVS